MTEPRAGEDDICRFDDAPIYQLADGEWLHYPDFKGDLFHSPEPKREAAVLTYLLARTGRT